jgi:hypothetical protein
LEKAAVGMTTYERKQRAEQERRQLTALAVQRRAENVGWTDIGRELEVPKSTAESMVRTSGALTCGCGEEMARPSLDGRCGFCQIEAAEVVTA